MTKVETMVALESPGYFRGMGLGVKGKTIDRMEISKSENMLLIYFTNGGLFAIHSYDRKDVLILASDLD